MPRRKVFNNGTSILKIGNEMCTLNNHVDNESQLTRVFQMFEKLFDYEQNIIKTKQDLMKNLFAEKTQQFKENTKLLEEIDQANREFLNQQKKFAKDQAFSQKDISKHFEETIERNREKVQSLAQASKKLDDKKSEFEKNLSEIEPKIKTLEEECQKLTTELKELKDEENGLIKSAHKEIAKQISELEQIRESTSYIEELQQAGVKITTENLADFKFNFRNLSKNYFKLLAMLKNKYFEANNVDSEYEKIISKLGTLNKSIQSLKAISTDERIQNPWKLVKFYFEKQGIIDIGKKNDQEALRCILSSKMEFDEDKDNALNLILLNDTVSIIFSTVKEVKEDFVQTRISSLNREIKSINSELSKTDNVKRIEKLEKNLEDKEEQKDLLTDNKRDILLILRTIDQINDEVRDMYIQSQIGKRLINCLEEIKTNYLPSIEILEKSFKLAIKN